MELLALGHSVHEGVKLENKVSEANARTVKAESDIAALNKATLEFAHMYDLSTNALAEANARLATIKPAKERLRDLLSDISGPKATEEMMQLLKSGKIVKFPAVFDGFRLHQMDEFLKNDKTKNCISITKTGMSISALGQSLSEQFDLTVFPSLLE